MQAHQATELLVAPVERQREALPRAARALGEAGAGAEGGHERGAREDGLPDVLLLDLRLPGIDGLEVLTEIRDTRGLESLPVVILTTSEAEWDRLKAYERHMNGYIVKPFDFDSFAVLLDVITLLMRDKKASRPV